jgi:hypothetical protein
MTKEQFYKDLQSRRLVVESKCDNETEDPLFWIESTNPEFDLPVSPSFFSLPELIAWWGRNRFIKEEVSNVNNH